MTVSGASAACSSSICKPASISNDRPVCLDSCRAISRKASRSLCWTCPDNRMTMGCEENEAIASSRSYERQNRHQNRADVRSADRYSLEISRSHEDQRGGNCFLHHDLVFQQGVPSAVLARRCLPKAPRSRLPGEIPRYSDGAAHVR